MLQKRAVAFFENVLGHPSLNAFGLSPGYNIKEELIDDVHVEIPNIAEELNEDRCRDTRCT